MLQTHSDHMIDGGDAEVLLEFAAEVRDRKVGSPGQRVQRDFVGVCSVDKSLYFQEPLGDCFTMHLTAEEAFDLQDKTVKQVAEDNRIRLLVAG